MGYKNSNENEVIINVESGETTHAATEIRNDPIPANKRDKKKKSLSKLFSGVLGFSELPKGGPGVKSDGVCETVELFVDKCNGGQQDQELVPLVGKDEKQKSGKAKKAPKPPRPPRGPSLDAADMRMVREIAKIAMKKRDRMERAKALKKIKAAKSSLPTSPTSSLMSASSGSTISAMIITVLFFLVIIFQALGSSNSSNMPIGEAPQPAPETTDLISVQLHHTIGAAPSFAPPKSTGQLTRAGFSSEG